MPMHLKSRSHKSKEYNSNYDLITHKKSNKYISLTKKMHDENERNRNDNECRIKQHHRIRGRTTQIRI